MPKISEIRPGVHRVVFPLPNTSRYKRVQEFTRSDIGVVSRVSQIIDSCKLGLGGASYEPAFSAQLPFGKDVCGNAAEVAVCRYFGLPWSTVIGAYDDGVDVEIVGKTAQIKFTGRMKNDFYFTSAEEVRQKFVADIGISVALDAEPPSDGHVLRLIVRGWISRRKFVELAKDRVYGLSMPAHGVRPWELEPMETIGWPHEGCPKI